MVTIHVQTDCNNSPKKELLRDFTTAFALSTPDVILDNLADDVRWEMVGDKIINGKADATAMVKEMLDGSIEELTLQHIITHGDEGSVNGLMTFKDGTKFSFCDVYTFTSHATDAKIKSITSYILEVKPI